MRKEKNIRTAKNTRRRLPAPCSASVKAMYAARVLKRNIELESQNLELNRMLDFVGMCVQEINSVATKKGERIEMICDPTGENIEIITCSGKTEIEAFRKCVGAAMAKTPNK